MYFLLIVSLLFFVLDSRLEHSTWWGYLAVKIKGYRSLRLQAILLDWRKDSIVATWLRLLAYIAIDSLWFLDLHEILIKQGRLLFPADSVSDKLAVLLCVVLPVDGGIGAYLLLAVVTRLLCQLELLGAEVTPTHKLHAVEHHCALRHSQGRIRLKLWIADLNNLVLQSIVAFAEVFRFIKRLWVDGLLSVSCDIVQHDRLDLHLQ